jgi:hypothetical protein
VRVTGLPDLLGTTLASHAIGGGAKKP